MSYFDDASLVMIPSGYKTSKVYSVKPTDGSGDLTFSRGSDIEATRVGPNGYIEKAQVNLALQSNTFSTTWIPSNASVTGGQSGYDGTNDAWLLSKSAAYGSIYQTGISVGNSSVYTFSVYMKAGTQNYGSIRFWTNNSGADFRVKFDLTTGAISTASANNGTRIDAVATDVGSGWWRVSVTGLTGQTSATLNIYAGDTADASGNIYIQDAQLNYGLVAQTYQETTTAAVVSGITDNMPRLSYDPANPTCPSLLLEPSRTNIQDQSEYIASWLDINSTQESNYATSPEGVQNATRMVMDSATGEHSVYDTVSVTSGTKYTQSIFLKQGDGSANWRYFQFRFRSGGFGGLYGVVVDLQEGTIGYDTGLDDFGIESYGNGWHRVWITATATTTSSNAGPVVAFNELADAYDVSIVGDTNADVLLWGAQFEAGSYPTSYIPTYGSSATRTADVCSKTGISSLIGQTEGTLFLDFVYDNNFANTRIFSVSGTNWLTQGSIRLEKSSGKFRWNFTSGGSASGALTSTTTMVVGQRYKIAVTYNSSTASLFVDGVKENTASVTLPTSMVDMHLNELGGGFSDANEFQTNLFNQVILFTSALSDADAITLTA